MTALTVATLAARSLRGTGSVAGPARSPEPSFATPRGLRRMLLEIYRSGWTEHPGVPDLFRHCQEKYTALARRHGQAPADVAAAAFEVLRKPSILDTDDPWAVVTRAVQRSLQAADRADRLLCSDDHARRLMSSGDRDVARFSDLTEDTTVPSIVERFTPDESAPHRETATLVRSAKDAGSARKTITDRDVELGLATVRTVMTVAGWPAADARVALEYVCHGVAEHESPISAFDALRRDTTPRHLIDVDQRTWTRLCRVLLGEPGRPGLLEQAMLGARPVDLLAEPAVAAKLAATAPGAAVHHA